MKNIISDAAFGRIMEFLISRTTERTGRELYKAHIVRRAEPGPGEKGDDPMNHILSIEYIAGMWRVDVRLPDGSRMAVSSSENLQDAIAKAGRVELDLEPA